MEYRGGMLSRRRRRTWSHSTGGTSKRTVIAPDITKYALSIDAARSGVTKLDRVEVDDGAALRSRGREDGSECRHEIVTKSATIIQTLNFKRKRSMRRS
jgi:hypothetical protein